MPRGTRARGPGRGAPTLTTALCLALQAATPFVAHVGRVSVVYWEGSEARAVALAEMADALRSWPGIPEPADRPIRLIMTSSERQFDSLTAGRLPRWGAAATFPATRTIVLKPSGDFHRILRHELAHLALHAVVIRVPRWFDEGYAARAAGEWDRLEALRVNWALVRGTIPSLHEVDRELQGSRAGEADVAYALATSAVLYLERLGGERGLQPLLERLGKTADFDLALRATYQITLGQFEAMWAKDLRKRYGWLLFFTSFAVFWSFVALLLVALWSRRKVRDRGRREALDDGWVIPEDDATPPT